MIPLLHPPYSPDLSLSDIFCLFLCIKKVFKGKHFTDVEGAKQKMAEPLKGFKIDKFKNCFEQWENRLNRCSASSGQHFEGD